MVAKKKVVKKPAHPVNNLFPGLDNYTGPQTGWFAMLHHTQLVENSGDNGYSGVQERVDYVKSTKPKREQKVRLANMIYIGDCEIIKALAAATVAAHAISKQFGFTAGLEVRNAVEGMRRATRPLVLDYIKAVKPDHAWDEKKGKITGTAD